MLRTPIPVRLAEPAAVVVVVLLLDDEPVFAPTDDPLRLGGTRPGAVCRFDGVGL